MECISTLRINKYTAYCIIQEAPVFHWKVLMDKQAEAELILLLNSKKITKEDIKVILKWVADMEEFGPDFGRQLLVTQDESFIE